MKRVGKRVFLASHVNFLWQFIWTELGYHHISSGDIILHHLMHCWTGFLFAFDWKHGGKTRRNRVDL